MRILVTSASGANGNGYGAVLGFGPEGDFTGPFSSDPRVADPRGLSLDPSGALVYLNSGEDRVLALDPDGHVVRDSGRIPGLDPGGAEFGPDGRYYLTVRRQQTIRAMPAALDAEGDYLLPEAVVPFPRGFGFGPDGRLYLSSGPGRAPGSAQRAGAGPLAYVNVGAGETARVRVPGGSGRGSWRWRSAGRPWWRAG
jgi:DNA-binding beta-propeller fold protein YncE